MKNIDSKSANIRDCLRCSCYQRKLFWAFFHVAGIRGDFDGPFDGPIFDCCEKTIKKLNS